MIQKRVRELVEAVPHEPGGEKGQQNGPGDGLQAGGRDPDAPQSGRQHAAMPRRIAPNLEEEQGIVLTPLPLYHIFSLTANLLAFALMGGLSVLVPDPRDIKGLIRTMRRAQVTTMTGVNTLFNALINTPDFAELDFSKLSFAVGGGAAVQSAVALRWREITGTDLVEGYGLTEASPVVCINPVRAPKLGTVGLPVSFDRSRHPRRCRQRSRRRRSRRDLRARAAGHAGLLAASRRDQARAQRRTAGCTPAISARSTRRDF